MIVGSSDVGKKINVNRGICVAGFFVSSHDVSIFERHASSFLISAHFTCLPRGETGPLAKWILLQRSVRGGESSTMDQTSHGKFTNNIGDEQTDLPFCVTKKITMGCVGG